MSTQLDDWLPNPLTKAFADGVALQGVDVEQELEKFRRYDHREAVRYPDKAFIAWLKKAVEHKRPAEAVEPSKPDEDVRWLDEIHAFQESQPVQFQRLKRYTEQHKWWKTAPRKYQIQRMRESIQERHVIFRYLDEQGRHF